MPELDQHILDYFIRHPNQSAGDIPPLAGKKIPRQTLSRRLAALVAEGQLIRMGRGAASRYLRADVDAYFQIPAVRRAPVPYIAERTSSSLPKFAPTALRLLHKAGGEHGATAEDVAREVRERLLVEFSYASSNLEGNTYDLIQTEALIKYGQVAQGKTAHEAKMILNHRDAIRYLLDNISCWVNWKRADDRCIFGPCKRRQRLPSSREEV